jgi:hypothetical protein
MPAGPPSDDFGVFEEFEVVLDAILADKVEDTSSEGRCAIIVLRSREIRYL